MSVQNKRLNVVGVYRGIIDGLIPPGSTARRSVGRWVLHPARDLLRRSIVRGRRLLAGDRRPADRSRILIVLHNAEGGVRETTRDLLSFLDSRFECFLLLASPWRLELLRHTPHGQDPLATWWLSRAWSHRRTRDEEHHRAYLEILGRVRPHLVHIRHLLGHTDELVDLCHRGAMPMVLSFHDYYMACPGIHLLDDNGRYCAGHCTPSRGQCRIPVPWLDDLPVLKAGYLDDWRTRVRAMLPSIDAFVTTSTASREVLVGVYPELAARDFRVIEHGRDFPVQLELATVPSPQGPVRIAVPGHLHYHKGSDFIRRLAEHDRQRQGVLELHFFGTTDPILREVGIHHGPYPRAAMASRLAAVRPSFVGLFSVWAETYSHTLTEAWALGVPVLGSGLGALGRRLRTHGGGWTVPVDDVGAAYRHILRIVGDPEDYRRQAARARIEAVPTVACMGRSYERLYSDLLGRTMLRPEASPP
jgi:glycosyltransferase involved in cell wall biosynthesis